MKNEILKELEKNRGVAISGEELASKLNVSRSAIWKNIKALRLLGYQISAITNRGYVLEKDSDVISEYSIKKYLDKSLNNLKIEVKKSTGSTNSDVKDRHIEGEGLVIISDEQTAGRGRQSRKFYSEKGLGIYMSVLLKPKCSAENSLFITTSAAVAVACAVEELSNLKTYIKWVNDIFLDGKKICGILTEAAIDFESGGLEYAVLGVGINVYSPKNNYDESIRGIAGSIFDENIKNEFRSKLIALILNKFFKFYKNLEKKEYLKEYRQRSFLINKEIEYVSGQDSYLAKVIDIDDMARLVVETKDGIKVLSSGEARICKY